MKTFKNLTVLLITLISLYSCNLEEDPIFLERNSVFSNETVTRATLDGIYQALTSYNAQERRYWSINGFSGFFATGKNGGNNVNNRNNANLFSLRPNFDQDSELMWGAIYSVIARCNAITNNVNIFESPSTSDELSFNDIVGQAHFVRAWSYFSLVRLFNDIPLWLKLPDNQNLSQSKTPAKEVYAQIIKDAQTAISLMNGQTGQGYPKPYAANMLLAKVYMTLATNPDLQQDGITENQYWQLAYDEAIKVYGNYNLVSDYASLFNGQNENSSESIFELQLSQDAANSQMGRNFTPFKYKVGQHFGWFSIHAKIIDEHMATYPDDPRIDATYLFEYDRIDNGFTIRRYPARDRNNYRNAHPYFFKFAEKDRQHSNQFNGQNIIVYRYGELLIMLAEISNELQNGEQLGYVTELLNRVGMTPHDGYLGSKDEFRDAIMREYRFEVLGEGEDAHNNRRRGYNYFLENIILEHNNYSQFDENVDLTLNTEQSQVMFLPIPLIEINTNDLID